MKKLLLYFLYFISPLPIILVLYSSEPFKYSDTTILIPMILGVCAFTWLTAEFVISARPKALERYFGLDKFYKFHTVMAIISLLIVFAHKLIQDYFMGDMSNTSFGEKSFYLFAAISALAMLFLVDTFVKIIPPLGIIKKAFKDFGIGKFQIQKLLHNLNILAEVLLLIHVLMSTSSKMHFAVRSLYIIYFVIGIGFYFYHKFLKIMLPGNNKYEVTEVLKESENISTIKLKPVKGSVINYKPGQFIFLRLFGKGISSEEHPFSISSSSVEKDYISVTIKELGDYTSKIRNIALGTKALIDGPFGTFSYVNEDKSKSLVFLAGGVGITPMLGMLRHLKATDKDRKVFLFWGVNNKKDLICEEELKEMLKSMKNFSFIPVFFRDDEVEGEKGIINSDKLERLAGDVKNDAIYFICGPAIMSKGAIKELANMGIPGNRIRHESFSL